MAKIIAIGGGEISKSETLNIDQEIIRFSGKKIPRFLFVPTASHDALGYIDGITRYFGDQLGCVVDTLCIAHDHLTQKKIRKKILDADIIYVGGGNTLFMMTRWRKLGIDKIFHEALKKDIVLCGISAGSICWFDHGNSDSRKFTSDSKKLIKVRGLGFIDALHCPHYDREPFRKKDLKRMMRRTPGVAIALEDGCALQIHDDTYRIITSKKNAGAYKIYWNNGKYYHNKIVAGHLYGPLAVLLQK